MGSQSQTHVMLLLISQIDQRNSKKNQSQTKGFQQWRISKTNNNKYIKSLRGFKTNKIS